MRNLKKSLALVLAVVMALSVMAAAGATNFVDDEDINAKYAEAVTVLTGIGVIRGIENADGSYRFEPKGELTRAQAATIIAYILTGDLDSIDGEVSVYENPFTDVAEWAIPYVLFSHSRGIIVGRNATTYDPNATITGYELGKMLLIASEICDAGDFAMTVYVVEGKAYATRDEAVVASLNAGGAEIVTKTVTNSDWQVTVAKELKNAGIWDGEFLLSKKLTREEACYLAFHTMMNTPALKEGVFGLTVSADVDAFGRTTKVYTSSVIEDLEIVLADHVAPTVFVAAAAATADVDGLNQLLNLTGNKALKGDAVAYVNGSAEGVSIQVGDMVEYYTEDGAVTKIVVIREALAQAQRASAAETVGEYEGLYKWTFGSDAFAYAEENAYEDGAYYIVIENPTTHAALSVEIPTVISKAKITASNHASLASATYLVVDGVKLHKASTFVDAVEGGVAYNTAYDFFMGSNGYLLAIAATGAVNVEETPVTGYAYLLGAEKQVTTTAVGSSLIGGAGSYQWAITAKAKLAMGNGTIQVVDLNTVLTTDEKGVVTAVKLNGQSVKNCEITNDAAPVDLMAEGNLFSGYSWVKYTVAKDGTYILESVAPTALTLGQGKAEISELSGKFATSKTVWTHYRYNTKTGAVEAVEVTGIANFKNGTYQGVAVYSTTNADIITALITFDTYAPEITANYAYYLGRGEYTYGLGYAEKFAINGSVVELFLDGVELGAVNTVYDLTMDTSGMVIGAEEVSFAKADAVEVTFVDSSFIFVGDETLYLDDSCVIYNVAGNEPTGEKDTLSAKPNAAGTGDMIKYITKDGKAVAIYIVTDAVKG